MMLKLHANTVILAISFFCTFTFSGVSRADTIDSAESWQEANRIASRMKGAIAFSGGEWGGNIDYVISAAVVPRDSVFAFRFETVPLLRVEKESDGRINTKSACGEGNASISPHALHTIYLLDKKGVATNILSNARVILTEDIRRESEKCFEKLHKLHVEKNISKISLINESGQKIDLTWFSEDKIDLYYVAIDGGISAYKNTSSGYDFEPYEIEKIVISESEKSNAPLLVEIQRSSQMHCYHGDEDKAIQNWKYGITPWIPLKNIGAGVFVDTNKIPPVFPAYEKGELDRLLKTNFGWDPKKSTCNPEDLAPKYRIRRGNTTIYEMHISWFFGC